MMNNLRKESLKGLLWMSLGKVGTGFVSLLVTMVLARILLPEDFALIELLIIFIAISNTFIDSGFSQAIIRDDCPSQVDLSSVFYLNLFISMIIYSVLFFLAPFIADFFNAPQLVLLSRVAFLVIIFNSLTIIQNANFVRELKFHIVSKCSIIGMTGAGISSITLAFLDFGVWAIVANMVLQPLFKAISLWYYSNWRPSFVFSVKTIRKYFSFGGFLLLQGIMDAIFTNIISLFIGRVYTKKDLGYYSQGRKLDGYIVVPFVTVITQVTYPITSKVKNNAERLKEGYKEIFRIIIFIFMPISMFVFFHGDLIVTTLFGDKWLKAGIYLSICSVFDLFFPLQRLCANIIMIKGKTKKMFYVAIIKQTIRLLVLIILSKISVLALAIGFTLSGIFGSILYIRLAFKLIKYDFMDFLKDQVKTIISTLLALSITLFFCKFLECGKYMTLTISLFMMVILYLFLSVLLNNRGLKSVQNLILEKM